MIISTVRSADDTATIQSALDACGRQSEGITLPCGQYTITQTLTYCGGYPEGLYLRGEHAAAGPSGTVLRWAGPPGGTVLRLLGACSTRIEGLAIGGAGIAARGISVEYDHDRKIGSQFVTISHCHVNGLVGENSAAISLGVRPDGTLDNYMCDSLWIDHCRLVGYKEPGTTRYGIVTGVGNAKNFAIRDCNLVGFQTGIRHNGPGFLAVDGCYFSSNKTVDIWSGNAAAELRSCGSEGSSRLFQGTMGANPGSVRISGWYWDGQDIPEDDIVIAYQGFLKLEGNHLYNRRTATSVPKVACLVGGGTPAALDSAGNFFFQAKGRIPVVDGSGNDVTTRHPESVRSWGDYGGAPGALTSLAIPPSRDLRIPGNLVVGGTITGAALDLGDGRRWTPDGLFNGVGKEWTPDGFYPGGGIKAPGCGTLVFGPGEGFRFVVWSVDPRTGQRRQDWIVPPLKGK